MNLRFDLSNPLRSQLLKRAYEAVQSMNYRLVRRIEIILDVLDGREMEGSAERYGVSTETVRLYIYEFILKQMASLVYKRPPGRPSKLTKSQRKELCQWIDEGPEKSGYECGHGFKHSDSLTCRGPKDLHLVFQPTLNKPEFVASFSWADISGRSHEEFVRLVSEFQSQMSAAVGESNVKIKVGA